MAKIASGMADDLLTCVILATRSPVILAPAMEEHMYNNSATQENLAKLESRGYFILKPVEGHLASGKFGLE